MKRALAIASVLCAACLCGAWTALKTIPAALVATQSSASVPWTPADLPGLALWLDASDAATLWADTNATAAATNGGAVTRWDDKSGNAKHLLTVASGANPICTATGIVFDGVNDRLAVPNSKTYFRFLHRGDPSEIWMVASHSVALNARAWVLTSTETDFTHVGVDVVVDRRSSVAATNRANIVVLGAAITPVAANRINDAFPASTVTMLRFDLDADNGTPSNRVATTINAGVLLRSNTDTAAAQTADSLRNMTRGATYDGVAACPLTMRELLISPATLSASDRQKMEGYLADKWDRINGNTILVDALPADHPYKSAPPTK